MASATTPAVLFACAVVVGLAAASNYSEDKKNWTTTTPLYKPGLKAAHEGGGSYQPRSCWCAPNTYCSFSAEGTKQCECKDGYIGDPPTCRPSPELWRGCFENNPCGLYAECEMVNGKRRCPRCLAFHEGSPPNCILHKDCRDAAKLCGPNSVCYPDFYPPCSCAYGFVGAPPNCKAGPALLAYCNPYPCGPNSNCYMQDGRPVCECAWNYVGTPPHCEPTPEMWRVCYKGAPCGQHSKCEMVNRGAICSPCDEGYNVEPPYCF